MVALALFAAIWAAGDSAAAPGAQGRKNQSTGACAAPGSWINGRTGEVLARTELFADLVRRPVVLLGETHDNAEHHRWQLHTLAALHGRSVKLVIGFEMFPRRVQPVLDRWVKGDLTEKAFLKAVDWRKVWGFDARLYMPLFNFARMHRIPMVALNVDRALVSRVGAEGWDAVPKDEREGLSDPAPASPAYQRVLAKVYLTKRALGARRKKHEKTATPQQKTTADMDSIANVMQEPGFKRFVAAQLTWDRAMAEGLATAKHAQRGAVIVGVMGSGHLSYFHGIPHQLDDLGVTRSAVLIPVAAGQACDKLGADYADAVFTVTSSAHAKSSRPRLRLGILVRDDKTAALVDRVMPDSVAAAAKLRKGDRIVRAAGVDVRSSGALIEVISRQAPGTWLPLTVEREGAEVELIAKFPATRKKGS
ncbi:MAG: ChaN family lipoprotein [Methyloligellaceae bacterium]